MGEDKFQQFKNSVALRLSKKPENLLEAAERHWSVIADRIYEFNRRAEQLKILDRIELSQVQSLFYVSFSIKFTENLIFHSSRIWI